MRELTNVARLAARHRPGGQPVMHQNWGKLLFMHWRINKDLLRPHIPLDLEIDTFSGSAWIAVTPFTMWDVRPFPPFLPALPGLNSMNETNVRTYVHYNGVPGVWFFSLDTDSSAAVIAARTFFHLPYYDAEIDFEQNGDHINYQLVREDEPAAEFQASWTIGKKLPVSQPGSREFFLTERYVLYTENDGELYQARIHHQPWALQKAELEEFDSNIIAASGLPEPDGEPLLHYAEEVNVDIWPLENVEDAK
jgi:uncharacterized protein